MALLGPKLFLAFALIFAAGWVLMPRKQPVKARNQAAVDWVAGRLDKTKDQHALNAELLRGEAEQAKAAGHEQADAVNVYADTEKPQGGGPKSVGELTVETLVRAMEEVIGSVPKIVPGLPLLPGMTRHFMARDPELITFGAMSPNVLGYFSTANPDKPRIVLNNDLKRLHAKGVTPEQLADVLVHELDHMMAYLTGRAPRRTRQENEVHAFVAEGYYITALRNRGKDGTVDAGHYDPEKDAYYQELKKVRIKLFAGELPDLIRETYGPDPAGQRRR